MLSHLAVNLFEAAIKFFGRFPWNKPVLNEYANLIVLSSWHFTIRYEVKVIWQGIFCSFNLFSTYLLNVQHEKPDRNSVFCISALL